MSKRKFSPAERHAVYTVHGERCYLCTCPLDLTTMEVDHVLPEDLLKNPEKLAEVLHSFGLPASFNLNSYANWLPACRPCNGKKLATLFKPAPIILLHLQNAQAKAREAAALAARTLADKEISNALNILERASEAGKLGDDVKLALQPLVALQREVRAPAMAKQPIRLTPLYEVLSDDGMIQTVRGPYGVGGRPSRPDAHSSFACPTCGAGAAWNGVICVRCGTVSDGD